MAYQSEQELEDNLVAQLAKKVDGKQQFEKANITDVESLRANLKKQLSKLNGFDISDNELGSVPEQIGACQRLVKVHLDANNLTRLPSTVRKLPRLMELTTDCNRIGTLALIPSLERLKSGSGTSSEAALLWEKRELGNGRIVSKRMYS